MTTGEQHADYTYNPDSGAREPGQTERLEVRLGVQRQQMLREIAAVYEVPRSEMVRKMIDEAYEDLLLERRRAAVRRLVAAQAEGEAMPDPDELSRQLAETYEVRSQE
ncbi:MAG: hypothetical protein EXR66_05280 [Dehalococcoidia bacterium]|nr:hypothetical protein [Dehalococcoidia bacterium]